MQRIYRALCMLFFIHHIQAVKVVERRYVRPKLAVEDCVDGKLFNPHMKDNKVCANLSDFANTLIGKSLAEIFTQVYEENYLLSAYSRSGFWANIAATQNIREGLYPLCMQLRVKTLLDLGCGDYYWMQTVDLDDIVYIGADIVAPLIKVNKRYFETATCTFMQLDATCDALPAADMILCRDLFSELSYADARAVLRACKASGASYLLATTHPKVHKNRDHHSGLHGQYNLRCAPFNLPEPLITIDEYNNNPQSWFEVKHLCLWALDDIEA